MASFILQLLCILLVALLIYCGCLALYNRRTGARMTARQVFIGLFVAYTVAIILLALQPRFTSDLPASAQTAAARLRSGANINLIPFRSIAQFASGGIDTAFLINIVGNVLLFVPLGFCLPFFWPRWRRFTKMLLVGAGFSFTIEFIQLFINRSVDIDDLILNTAGVLLGYAVCMLACALQAKKTGA